MSLIAVVKTLNAGHDFERQKIFQASSVLLESLESRKTTDFEIQLKYDNLSKNLSL